MITKLYLDNCCYSRFFDDFSQKEIELEAKALKIILEKYIKKELDIYKSLAIDFEISKMKNNIKKIQVMVLYKTLNLAKIEYMVEVKQRALELKNYNIKDMDALHLAFAEKGDVDYFITTDKILINASKRANLKFKVMNPIEFIIGGGLYEK